MEGAVRTVNSVGTSPIEKKLRFSSYTWYVLLQNLTSFRPQLLLVGGFLLQGVRRPELTRVDQRRV